MQDPTTTSMTNDEEAQIFPGELHAEESVGFIYMHKANWKLPLHETEAWKNNC